MPASTSPNTPRAPGATGQAPGGSAAERSGRSGLLPPVLLRYSLAVAAVVVVLAIRLAAWPLLGNEIPWIPFAPAIILAAWYGGIGPAIAATLLSALATSYFLMEPPHVLGIHTAAEATGLVVFILTGGLMSLLVERMRAARAALWMANEALREANEDLREAGRRKDEFVAMLSHELRNPLAAISTAVHLMEARGLGDPMLERARAAAERQCQHMARLLDDLLDVSRVTHGKISLKQEEIDLRTVIDSAVDVVRPLIQSRAQTLSQDVAEGLTVTGDRVRLAQVVTNLLNNAAKFTPPGGQIQLSLDDFDGQALLRVRDNGAGIDQDLLPRVFDLFVQGERSLARTEGGLGIGLTLARTLVEMHGGCIEARSDGPGKGSEFIVYLPLAQALKTQDLSGPGHNAEVQTRKPHRRILVVDDNADMAEMLAMTLETEGHEVVTTLSGPAALDLAGHYRPDVVLLDLGMPGMDGYEVARRLRHVLGNVCIVAVTGYGQEEDVRHTQAAGFAGHLVKPVDLNALRWVLHGRIRE